MDLYRMGIKVFCAEPAPLDLPELIPVFHRFIQGGSLDGLLIDVADYSHVYHGPGILLVAHEGNYALDECGGRRGLVYYAKRRGEGTLAQRLASVCRRAFLACRRLAEQPELAARLAFSGEAIQVFANDRLLAPNTDQTLAALRPALEALCDRLYRDQTWEITRNGAEPERFSVTLRASAPIGIDDLLTHLGD
ncbi:MAG: hypothetical protein ACT4QB_09265 [Gammaproteobacteria bacterium]